MNPKSNDALSLPLVPSCILGYLPSMSVPHKTLELIAPAAPSRQEREGLPLYLSPVEAGFSSPADDDLEQRLDLHEHLVRNEAATFFLRAHGDSFA